MATINVKKERLRAIVNKLYRTKGPINQRNIVKEHITKAGLYRGDKAVGMANSSVHRLGMALLLIGCLFSLTGVNQAARILTIPLPLGSHIMTMEQVSAGLIEKGHQVYAVINKACRGTKNLEAAGVKVYPITTPSGCYMESQEYQKKQMQRLFNSSVSQLLSGSKQKIGGYFLEEAEALLNDKVTADLRDLQFDLCILSGIGITKHVFILPYKLDLPVIAVNAPMDRLITGLPALPSFTPQRVDSTNTNRMNYPQRFKNVLMVFGVPLILSWFNPLCSNDLVIKYASEKPFVPLTQLVSNTKLWLFLDDVVLDYPQVSLPHIVDIGGLSTKPAGKLPQELQHFADSASHGLIVISFGALAINLPAAITEMIHSDLKKLKQNIVWRYTGPELKDVPRNIRIVDWMPQNDLLGHPNTKVFVTHCGTNSQFEALYHAVPMVGIPFGADQKYNARRMVNKNMGVMLDLQLMVKGGLMAAINEVANNETFSQSIKRYSTIFKDRPMTPKETAVYWIEHFLKYGADHLRTTGIEMPAYQYWCLDVVVPLTLVIILIAWLMVRFSVFTFKKLYRCCCSQSNKNSSSKKKQL